MSDARGRIPGTRPIGAGIAAAALLAAWWGVPRVAPGSLADAGRWPDARVDVNAASSAELCQLPGIGPGLARRIVADRAACGPFAGLDGLDRVYGVGPATIEGLRPYAVAGE